MKKFFITAMVVALSLSAMATQTSTVRIKLVGSNPTYATSTITLNEDDARTSAYESGYDSESMMSLSNPYSVLLYSYIGSQPCEIVATNSLSNQKLSFKTNLLDQNYTLQFSDFAGAELTLKDMVTGDVVTINASTPDYAFSVTAEQVGRVEVKDRFIINFARVPDAGELEICHKDNQLQLLNNPYLENIVVKDADGNIVINEPSTNTPQYIDISALAAGQYTVELNNGNRSFIIKK